MKVLDSLIKVAKYRLEQAEQRRAFVASRIGRLIQSRQIVEDDLRQLQQRYAISFADNVDIVTPTSLVALRQIWFEAVERQKLMVSMAEQLAILLGEKDLLDQEVKDAWARKKSLSRAQELNTLHVREQAARHAWTQADESWSHMQLAKPKLVRT